MQSARLTFVVRKGEAFISHTFHRTGKNRNAIRSQINLLAKALVKETQCVLLPLVSGVHPSIVWE